MLLCGTHDGLYDLADGSPEQVLDCGRVWDLDRDGDRYYAGTADGLYVSNDGRSWEHEPLDGVPTAVLSEDGGVLVGTEPVGVYRQTPGSGDSGIAWQPVGDLSAHPHGTRWRDRASGGSSTVRTLALHPEDGVLAGLEPGGVYAFDGDFWRQYGDGVHDDVHDLLVLDDGDVIAATGNGLYRCSDGAAWIRLDVDFRDFWANYFRETASFEGRVYASANTEGHEAPGGVLLDGPVDGDDTMDTFGFDSTPVPTADPAFITSWAIDGGTLYAGTMRVDDESFLQTTPATVLALEADGWTAVAELPAGITALVGDPVVQ